MSSYPSVVANLSNPAATDRLSNPSHSALHTSENAEIEQIQTFIGTIPASAVGTIIYDVRSPDSDGGGHIQSAVKGGTGQVIYNKGDLLVGQSASVLGKLALGTDGQALKVNSSTATGVAWVSNDTPKIAISTTSVFNVNTTSITTLLTANIAGSTLGTNNAIRARIFVSVLGLYNTADVFIVNASYGGTSIASVGIGSVAATSGPENSGFIDFNLLANNSQTSQIGILSTDVYGAPIRSSLIGGKKYMTGPINQNSAAQKTLLITGQFNYSSVANAQVMVTGYTIEKIT